MACMSGSLSDATLSYDLHRKGDVPPPHHRLRGHEAKYTHVKSRKRKKFQTLRFCEILTVTPLMAMAPVHRVLFVLLHALSG